MERDDTRDCGPREALRLPLRLASTLSNKRSAAGLDLRVLATQLVDTGILAHTVTVFVSARPDRSRLPC